MQHPFTVLLFNIFKFVADLAGEFRHTNVLLLAQLIQYMFQKTQGQINRLKTVVVDICTLGGAWGPLAFTAGLGAPADSGLV